MTNSDKTDDLVFKVPKKLCSRKRDNKINVLDEDAYEESVCQIVERDFFPEIKMLKDQCDFVDALNNQIIGSDTSSLISSTNFVKNDSLSTPKEISLQTYVDTSTSTVKKKLPSLDTFLQTHTSEDNESFHELIEDSKERFRANKSWMFSENEKKSILMKEERLSLPSLKEQADGKCSNDGNIDGWIYKNVNPIFYTPDGVKLTRKELFEKATKQESINYRNTRFSTRNENDSTVLKGIVKQNVNVGRVGFDGKVLDCPQTPTVNGFTYMKSPSPIPGAAGESPFMTWGEIEGTPCRLECPSPSPFRSKDGPKFTIQNVPKRERIAHRLAEKNSRLHRNKKDIAIAKARSHIKTPSSSSMSQRAASMSPAAQRLASTQLGIRIGSDKRLQVLHTPSPSIRGSYTPTFSKSSICSPNDSSLKKERLSDGDLLKHSTNDTHALSNKRPLASDFF